MEMGATYLVHCERVWDKINVEKDQTVIQNEWPRIGANICIRSNRAPDRERTAGLTHAYGAAYLDLEDWN